MGYVPPYESTSEIQDLCMQIAEMVGRISPEAALLRSPSLHKELHIRSIHSSRLIEGNQLDSQAVAAILDGERV